jgi:hypothetical protein
MYPDFYGLVISLLAYKASKLKCPPATGLAMKSIFRFVGNPPSVISYRSVKAKFMIALFSQFASDVTKRLLVVWVQVAAVHISQSLFLYSCRESRSTLKICEIGRIASKVGIGVRHENHVTTFFHLR